MSKLLRLQFLLTSFFVGLLFSFLTASEVNAQVQCTGYTKVCPGVGSSGCRNTGTAQNPNCTCAGNEVNYQPCRDNGSGSCVSYIKNQICAWDGGKCALIGPGNDVQTTCGVGDVTPPPDGGNCPITTFQYDCRSSSISCNSGGWDGEASGADCRSQGKTCGSNEHCCKKEICVSPPPQACNKLYFCDTSDKYNYKCIQTESEYNSQQLQCPGLVPSCSQNLAAYHPGTTTGSCFNSLAECQSSCKTPQVAYCQDIRAYTTSWQLLTNQQLRELKPGQKIEFCSSGFAAGVSGGFTAVRYRVNGTWEPEYAHKRTGSTTDLCAPYVIPGGVTNFSVVGQMKHSVLGWVN